MTKAPNPDWQEAFDFLDNLRDSGVTNMFGARPYLERQFGLDNRILGVD
jgi:hypothetical protein